MSAVVFDLDGTLIDSRADIAAAANYALGVHGREPLDEAVVASFVGDGARWLVARAMGLSFDDPSVDPVLETFVEYYTDHAADRTTLMPGAAEALDALSDMPLAVCTNKPRAATGAVLRSLGIEHAFSVIVAGGDLPFKKPDPEPLLFIAERLEVAPESLIIVGDGVQDVQSARAIGARSIAVTGGFGSRAALEEAKPSALVDSLLEVVDVVRRFELEATGHK